MTEFAKWLLGEWTLHEFCLGQQQPMSEDQVRELSKLSRSLLDGITPSLLDRLGRDGCERWYRQTFRARAPEVLHV